MFIVLLALSLIFIFLAYYIENPLLAIGGFFFLFVLGTILFQGQLLLQSGSLTSVSGNETTETFLYTNFSDVAGTYFDIFSVSHFLGVLISAISVLGMVMSLTDIKYFKRRNDE